MRNKAEAIKQMCLSCAGGHPKEVTLCQVIDCPLWIYRFGYGYRDKRFLIRMNKARANYPDEFSELRNIIREHLSNGSMDLENEQIRAVFSEILDKSIGGD
jgi:hypothetical protein